MSANKAAAKDNETGAGKRASASLPRKRMQEDPRKGGKGQSARVPRQGAGGFAPSTGSLLPAPSGKAPALPSQVPPRDPELLSDGAYPTTHYKGTALKNIGRYPDGKVIPHKRSAVTAKKVAIWVAGGYNKNDIAVLLNIRPGLVERHYGVELHHGGDVVGMRMTEHIVRRAKKSDRMAMFYAKARMGWREGDSATPVDVSPLQIHIHT